VIIIIIFVHIDAENPICVKSSNYCTNTYDLIIRIAMDQSFTT
jgi:hypothetical protein